MTDRILTLRELNRATLARQMLLKREKIPVASAIERLGGLQAQLAISPYIGLWTRLQDFKREDLARLIESRKVVKATFMRATLHLVTAADYLRFRTTIQSALNLAAESIVKRRGSAPDSAKILAAARKFIAEKPRSFADITEMLLKLMPDEDAGAMRYTVRTQLPLVQEPTDSAWSYPGNPNFALAQSWLGKPISSKEDLRGLIRRYIGAFGPASMKDMQTWSAIPIPAETIEKLKPELVSYRDEKKRELFDLPEMEIPSADAPAPARFLPEYDNILLSHVHRTRIVADEHRKKVFLPGLRVRSTILIDGFVRGGWKIEKAKTGATLTVEPFEKLTAKDRAAIEEEGERLIRFVEPAAQSFEVRFVAK